MKKAALIVLTVLLIAELAAVFMLQKAQSADPSIELTATHTLHDQMHPLKTIAFTKPTNPTDPTEPPEPTIPPLADKPGYVFDSYHSDEYDDYLDYYVHIPENATVGMPLVVYLHGDGEVNKPELLPRTGLCHIVRSVYGEEFPFLLLEPNTRVKSWTSGNIPKLLIKLIDFVSERYSVNTDKIIICGHSRGAMGVWDMISIYGDYFSAAVPVSSPHQKGHIDYLKAAEVPVWTFAGDVGDIEQWYHQYLAKNVEMITVSGGFGKFTVLEGANHGRAFYRAFEKETFEWMLAQERGVIPEA